MLLSELFQERLELRVKKSAGLAQQLVNAPQIKGGNYKLVIDYALAKGLAHEAFGHASETDGMETSILGKAGKMRLGENMAASMVTITDGPVLGDYAYQPFSANGMPRQTIDILKDGVLQAGLGDLFSAGKAGVPISGAERIESYRNLPLPRMTNIRITVKDPVPFETRFELVTPQELRETLIQSGLLKEGEPALYLAGYKGGQVNPKEGDFVFNCVAIYDLSQPDLPLYQPAIFSGKVLAALHSILGGLGPLHLDAMGHCGKGGQSVPSSARGAQLCRSRLQRQRIYRRSELMSEILDDNAQYVEALTELLGRAERGEIGADLPRLRGWRVRCLTRAVGVAFDCR